MIARQDIEALVAQAALAPNVHNTQPARWRAEADGATLFEDLRRRLTAGDPTGHDAAISLGAVAEGFRIAASVAGYGVEPAQAEAASDAQLRPVARFKLTSGGTADPLANFVEQRRSWRAAFDTVTSSDRTTAHVVASEDTAVLADPETLKQAGEVLNRASWSFIARDDFRAELLAWMRLKRSHPDWARDGMNTDAMAMSGFEGFGAGLVLGPLFKPLKSLGLAQSLTAEAKLAEGAAALVLFYRPRGEDPFVSGANFYRLWLRVEQAGFAASVLASLADDPQASQWCCAQAKIGADRRLVNVLRIGRRTGAAAPRARLPLAEVLVG